MATEPDDRSTRTFQPVGPINTSIPRAQTAFRNRIPEWLPTLSQLPQPISRSFLAYNQTKANRGQYPLTNPQAQLALQAALTGQAQTPREDPGGIIDLPRNALEDVRTITTALPRMLIPNRGNPLYEEAVGLLNLPQNISTAMAKGDNLGEDIEALSEQPGIRMIPGAYVAGNLAAGDTEELVQHPIYTALDVLPFASKAVKGLPVNRAAQEAFGRQLSETVATPLERGLTSTTINPAAAPTLRAPGAFRTAMTRTLDESGNVVPNKLGAFTQRVGAAALRSEGGVGGVADLTPRFGLGRLGKANRATVRTIAQIEDQARLLVEGRNPAAIAEVQSPTLRTALQSYADLYEKHGDMLGRTDDLSDRMQRGQRSTFTPEEEAFVRDWESTQRLAAEHLAAEGQLKIVSNADLKTPEAQAMMSGEILPVTGLGDAWSRVRAADNGLYKARVRQAEFADRMKWTRDALLGPDPAALSAAYQNLGLTSPVPPVAATQTFLNELDNMALTGLDADLARQFRNEVNKIGRTANPRVTMEASVRARRYLGRMRQRGAFRQLDTDMTQAEIGFATKWARDAYKRGTFRSHQRAVARAQQRLDTAMLKATPARFMPDVLDEFDNIIKSELDNPANMLSADEALMGHRLVNDGVYKGLAQVFGGSDEAGLAYGKKLIAEWEDQARRVWVDGKSAGSNPVFLHHVAPEYAADIRPRISDRIMSPSQAKARTFDARPYVGSPSVALDHQMMELVSRRGSEELVETVGTMYGKTESQLFQQFYDETGSAREATRLIEQTTREWPPPNFGVGKKVSNSARAADKVRVPKQLVDTMETLNTRTKLDAIFDPVMKVFRTAVLPLAPRWQVYNILGGGAIMTAANPLAWRQMGKALRAMSEAEGGGLVKVAGDAWNQRMTQKPSTTPVGAPSTGGGGSGLMVSEDLLKPPPSRAGKVAATKSWMQGSELRRITEQFAEWRKTQPGGKTWFGRGVDVSYAANAWWDNLYRTATSIESYESAIKAGKGAKAAELEAIKGVRSVMQNWDELLPMERQVLRTLFPFYSWARFSLGFVMRFPFDHPVRAAVMASFARAELEDQGSGLPENFLGLFQLNSMDENGNANFLRTSGFNPFRDTTDWFTLAGFVGQTNPFISASLQALGVNPAQGGPTLYPTLQYDPETGGLKADTPGFGGALITSTLPQARLIHNLVIGNAKWNELVQRDPEAARAQLVGQMGLPVMVESNNIPQEQFRAEMNRYQIFTDERQAAQREGTLEGLYRTYGDLPINAEGATLSAYLDQLGALEAAGLLEPLRPTEPTVSPAEMVRSMGGIARVPATSG